MTPSRVLTGALVVGAVAIASVFAAAPASAATLPSGQRITIIGQQTDQFYDASPVDAALTPVGNFGLQTELCTSGVDVDDTGLGYAIGTESTFGCIKDEAPSATALYTANAATGELTGGTPITIDVGLGTVDADECTAIDYSSGVITAVCNVYTESSDFGYIGTVDPTTAVLTPYIQFVDEAFLPLSAIARNPITGILYAFAYIPGNQFFVIDPDEGIGVGHEMEVPVFGADFDRSGQLWVTTLLDPQDGAVSAGLATVDLTTGTSPFQAQYTLGGNLLEEFSSALTVWGSAPALAATGSAPNLGVGLGAALFLLVGVTLAAVTIVRRRATES